MGGGSQPIPNAHWAPVQFVLTVPSIRDRVVQGALKLILEPIFEADFQPGSYGYRPKQSAQAALQRVSEAIVQGKTYLIDLDLKSYLDLSPQCPLTHETTLVGRLPL